MIWTSLLQGAVTSLLFSKFVSAAALPSCNTPSNRACWVTGYDINTDYESKTPTTGVTVPVSTEAIRVSTTLTVLVHFDYNRGR